MSYIIRRGEKIVGTLSSFKEAVSTAKDILSRAEEDEFTLTIHTEIARVTKKLVRRIDITVDEIEQFRPKGIPV